MTQHWVRAAEQNGSRQQRPEWQIMGSTRSFPFLGAKHPRTKGAANGHLPRTTVMAIPATLFDLFYDYRRTLIRRHFASLIKPLATFIRKT